jgi:hypothetical protein
MRLFLNGEECDGTLAAGSTYTLNADGSGNLLLTVTFSSDPDTDMTCGGLLKTAFAPEKLAILLQENGEHFAMVGSDDFFNASDNGDITLGNFTGSCVSQANLGRVAIKPARRAISSSGMLKSLSAFAEESAICDGCSNIAPTE